MAGELRLKQFVNEEVKPMVRLTIPDLIKRMERLERFYAAGKTAKAEIPKFTPKVPAKKTK